MAQAFAPQTANIGGATRKQHGLIDLRCLVCLGLASTRLLAGLLALLLSSRLASGPGSLAELHDAKPPSPNQLRTKHTLRCVLIISNCQHRQATGPPVHGANFSNSATLRYSCIGDLGSPFGYHWHSNQLETITRGINFANHQAELPTKGIPDQLHYCRARSRTHKTRH